jgi:ABC-type transport system involved in cytochrome bd biosynthesis fused ATPase/permease subunit
MPCPQVGSGKSSVLAALLGEMQPIRTDACEAATRDGSSLSLSGNSDTAPAISGRVAYCSQVPWVVAGSVKVRRSI